MFRHSGESRNPEVTKGLPGLAPAGDLLSCSCKKVSKEARPASPALRTEGSPESRPFARRTAKQLAVRNPALTPRCESSAGPVAKLAGQNPAVVRQRDRTTPCEPCSLGGTVRKANHPAFLAAAKSIPTTTHMSWIQRLQKTDNGQSESEIVDQYYANEMLLGFDGKRRLTDVQRPVPLPSDGSSAEVWARAFYLQTKVTLLRPIPPPSS